MPHSSILPRILAGMALFYSCIGLYAQCPAAMPAPAITGTEQAVVVDEILTSGKVKWYFGPAITMNSLTLRGGKLIVQGDLTIDKFYMDSGQIIINPGGRFVIGGGIGSGLQLFGGCSFYNYGKLECRRNLSMENGWASAANPNIIVNATPSSTFIVWNNYFVINNANSWFVNNGVAQAQGVITDNQSSPRSVCLGPQSHLTMDILINKINNAYTVSSGSACVYVVQLSQFYGKLTNSPSLFACLAATHHSDASCVPFGCTPNYWGAASVVTSCNTCASLGVLPIAFTEFSVSTGASNRLDWKMDINLNAAAYQFYVDRSADGTNYAVIDSVRGAFAASYSYTDTRVPAGISYYRIRCTDLVTGRIIFSKTVSSKRLQPGGIHVFPSPFSGHFYVSTPAGEKVEKIAVHTINGNNVPVRCEQQALQYMVTPAVTCGRQVLLVQVITNAGIRTEKVVSGE